MIIFSPRAFAVVLSQLSKHKDDETGGLLLGIYRDENFYVYDTVLPGPGSVHSECTFIPDQLYASYYANELKDIYKEDIRIIGLWHSHTDNKEFSLTDEDTNHIYASLNPFGCVSVLIDRSDHSVICRQVNKDRNDTVGYVVKTFDVRYVCCRSDNNDTKIVFLT